MLTRQRNLYPGRPVSGCECAACKVVKPRWACIFFVLHATGNTPIIGVVSPIDPLEIQITPLFFTNENSFKPTVASSKNGSCITDQDVVKSRPGLAGDWVR